MRIRSFNILVVSFLLVFVTAGVSQLCAAPVTSFKESKIKTVVKEYIHANAPWPQENVRIEFLGRIADVSIQGERFSVKIRSRRDESFIGDSTFTVTVYDEGTLLRELTGRVRWKWLLTVVISTKISRGAILIAMMNKLTRKCSIRYPLCGDANRRWPGKYLYGI